MKYDKNSKPFLFIMTSFIITSIIYGSNPIRIPDPPGRPEVNEIKAGACTITYEPPKYDGGAPVHRYIIEYKYFWGLKWNILGSSPNLTYYTNYFEDGDKVKFRISAENIVGTSKPSPPSDPITLKNPI